LIVLSHGGRNYQSVSMMMSLKKVEARRRAVRGTLSLRANAWVCCYLTRYFVAPERGNSII
jgi:hypothetical protein